MTTKPVDAKSGSLPAHPTIKPANSFAVTVPRPDGAGQYTVTEYYYHAPENVLLPCVVRPADLQPIAPLDAALGTGGPAYAGITVAGVDQEIQFYAAVLGLEKKRDFELSDPNLLAAAGLPGDAKVRFVQLFAPGTQSANLTLIDLGPKGQRNDKVRAPNRGIVMWTFFVSDILEARNRVKAERGIVIFGPVAISSPYLGDHKVMTVLTPAGMLLELVENTAQ